MTTWTNRYLAAVMRAVPEQTRDDLDAELRSTIDDAVAARTDGGEPQEDAERAVLTELGHPERLAAASVDRPLHLLGPSVYLDWRRVLRMLLMLVLPLAAIGTALVRILAGASAGEVLGGTLATTITLGMHLLVWTTLLFVVIERTGRGPDRSDWSLEALPEPRPDGGGRSDLIATLIFLATVVGAAVWDRFVGFVQIDGAPLPLLSPELWPVWILLPPAVLAAAAFAVALHRAPGWTRSLAAANTLLSVLVAGAVLALLAGGSLLNAEAFELLAEDEDSVRTTVVVGSALGTVVISGWSILDGWRKARSRTGR
ncbi:permease prefix domain 1-containing protein [Nesterenkonia sp. F]|uniref:permease prefix domain 1-containing protein n=1 Tax=Nesterenkonia sp. F TaxID=795955 RepID=UPI000255C8C3|nr:permease prefix domain 1-containing protein [Nesterenkonia sp. F]